MLTIEDIAPRFKIYAGFPRGIRSKIFNFMALDNLATAYPSAYILSPKYDLNLHLCQFLFFSSSHSLTLLISKDQSQMSLWQILFGILQHQT